MPYLVRELEDKSYESFENERPFAARALGAIGPEAKEVLPALMRTMKISDEEDNAGAIRKNTLESMVRIDPRSDQVADLLIEIAKDMICGVHWSDVGDGSVDLDLSLISLEHGKMGWDSSYRSDDSAILFSGDNTSAPKPKGASELYYISQAHDDVMLVNLNYYNRHSYVYGIRGRRS